MILPAEAVRARLASGNCVIRTGELVDVGRLTSAELAGCKFEDGSGFVLTAGEGAPKREVQRRPALKRGKRHKKREKSMDVHQEVGGGVVTPTVEVIASAMPDSALAAISLPDAGIPSVKALAGAAPVDLRSVLPDASNTSGLTVVLAGIAVLGGGAAWKFYSTFSKQKHEQAMARIESERQGHEKCDASRAALESRVNAMSSQLSDAVRKLEEVARMLEDQRHKNAALRGFDPEDIEARVEVVEKALKKARRK